jgi:alpha-tubulin suppressor-like RCC1 family protein
MNAYYIVQGKVALSGGAPLKTALYFGILASGSEHTSYISRLHTWAWGANFTGGLGINSVTNKCTPTSILGTRKTFCQISAGGYKTATIDSSGQVWAWGDNFSGQLGNNSIISERTPVSILGAKKTFCQIASGRSYISAIDKNGLVWGWGDNDKGQLGNNSIISERTPVSILGAKKTFCKISSGLGTTIVIDKNGQVWGWGDNYGGQLGDNTIISKRTPVTILGVKKTFCQIAVGGLHTIGLDKNGQVWGWGYNNQGELGDNSIVSKLTPVSILGAKKTFCHIAAGSQYAVGIDKNGQVWGWGNGYDGQLGNNGAISILTPVSLFGVKKTFCRINCGDMHVAAVDKYGYLWGWGYNGSGQLGNNSTTAKCTPVRICNI